jgi:tRNA dimethylallyltransferase
LPGVPDGIACDLLAICGPTATGKTRLGVELALRLGGEVLSVDSRQVYRGLDLGAGKDLGEYRTPRGQVPHHLVDIADPTEVYTLWRFTADFAAAYADVRGRGRLPVAVGGTGLYLEAVLRGYRIPPAPPDDRARARLGDLPLPELVRRLTRAAPEALAATDAANRRRVLRALEVAAQPGPAAPAPAPAPAPAHRHPVVVGVRTERSVLRQRIAQRLDERLAAGLVNEVRGLLGRGVTPARLAQLGMEYRHVGRFLAGEVDYAAMCGQLRRDIGRLAKRQETWFRGMERRGVPVYWVDGTDAEAAVERVERLVRGAVAGSGDAVANAG